MSSTLLDVADLRVTFNTPTGPVRAVRGLSLDVQRQEILGVVGESGCGKSVTFRALLGLTPGSASVDGQVMFDGEPVLDNSELRDHVGLIYQNPGAALNPIFTIGQQLDLALNPTGTLSGDSDTKAEHQRKMEGLLERVGLPDPPGALRSYPHEFSGGMKQRAVIAFALASDPQLLIADEPTTALDVTTQAQVLQLLRDLRESDDLSIVFISHDLAVIRQICDRIAVLYAGEVVEIGTVDDVLNAPTHPYTKALLDSIPTEANLGGELTTIAGAVPDGRDEIFGCAFAPRCMYVQDVCRVERPEQLQITPSHSAACVLVESQP